MRCAVIKIHPADEIVGAGYLISKLVDATVLHVTDGAPCDKHDVEAAGFASVPICGRADRNASKPRRSPNVPEDRVVDLAIPDRSVPQKPRAPQQKNNDFPRNRRAHRPDPSL